MATADASVRASHLVSLAAGCSRVLFAVSRPARSKTDAATFVRCGQREREFAAAYYEEFEPGYIVTCNQIVETLTDPLFVLQPFDHTKFIVSFAGNGTVAYLHDKDYNQPIYFINETKKIRREFPFYFFMNEEEKLQPIR